MTIGLITACSSIPNLNQSQLRGFSTAGQKQPAAKNKTATPASQGQPLPSCHQFNTVSTPRAAAMTTPKERSELRTTFSSREKLSCVVWVLMNYALAFEGDRAIGRLAQSTHSQNPVEPLGVQPTDGGTFGYHVVGQQAITAMSTGICSTKRVTMAAALTETRGT